MEGCPDRNSEQELKSRSLEAGTMLACTFLMGRLEGLLDRGQGLESGDVSKRKTPVGTLVAWHLAAL